MSKATSLSLIKCLLVSLSIAVAVESWARTGNYLIVTAQEFSQTAPLAQFAAAKASQGFNVLTYVVPPGATKEEIKAYILSLWETPNAPHYILIVGDTPAVPHWTGGGSKHAPTDLPYACMDPGDDWYPDIAIGRFSVANVDQLQAIVDKTLFVEAGNFPDPDYVRRAAFLATSDPSAQAEQLHDWVISTYLEPAEYVPIRIYASQGGGTQDITNAVNNGCLWVNYFGHSGSGGWSSPFFNQANVSALSNTGLYGLVFGFSCNTAAYTSSECFGETWIRVANRGAAAYISASTFIYYGGTAWESSRRVEKYFWQSFFVDDIWEVGPAWQAGMYRFVADPDFDLDVKRNMFEMFVLFGDPSLLLPRPYGFTASVQPPYRDICSLTQDQTTYTVEVLPTGGFAEPVTLEVTGLPPGSVAEFSSNQVPPPFTSVLTVSGLLGVPAGQYDLVISATAQSMQRAMPAQLNVSDAAPGPVVPVSPPDGATQIPRRPMLVWEPVPAALRYDVQVAADPQFNQVVYSAVSSQSQHALSVYLDPATVYYWRVRAVNGCGEGVFGMPFSFTTVEQSDYFTQLFTGGANSFDLDNFTIALLPDGSYDYYALCGLPASALPTDPTGGTVLTLGDDTSVAVTLATPVQLYGVAYTTMYVGSNGYITFTSGDSGYNESFGAHFDRPRISALFDDLNPGAGGQVSYRVLDDRVAVTWLNVPEYGTTNQNTFQVEMFYDGKIHITWLRIDVNDALVGISAGGGIPGDFEETDLSAAGPCLWADFSVSVTPAAQAVCAPADAVYVVSVEQLLGYSRPVTLTLSGQPAGTVAEFSVNSVPPPFTSQLTLSNTAAAPPGHYILEVTGTSPDYAHSTSAELDLANAIPPAVVLLTPPNGAVGVDQRPTLSWQPATQATEYELEVAEDPAFTIVRYQTTLTLTSHTLPVTLDLNRRYYWHVRGLNACGTGEWSQTFSFTTVGLPEYFTEQFTGSGDPFDLDNLRLIFTPSGGADFYRACGETITTLPTDPAGGTVLALSDDSFAGIDLPGGVQVYLYGIGYSRFYVGSNGYITFNSGDTDYTETLADHFNRPRISALFDDLNPGAGGQVSWRQLPDHVAVTWYQVREYGTTNQNTFQIELYFDGTISIAWLRIDVLDAIAGLSRGNGVPPDFTESDLSATRACQHPGDLNCDGMVNAFDIDPFVLALTDPAGYVNIYPDCDIANADINDDGTVNSFDIDPFVELLTGGA